MPSTTTFHRQLHNTDKMLKKKEFFAEHEVYK